ncbi:MAG: hypothetical protein QHH13_09800 [Melioribacter sp.]|uniref:hypothetical protein n=1 Tax=Rosettibacter primus TaxID=3111523 RepID=UPI00247E4D0A|nr:hypothetical protein [Melioribacter sp.]
MTKTKSFLFWFLALLITISSAIYQRITGPTYPLRGEIKFENKTINYKLERSHSSNQNYTINIKTEDENIRGILYWRRYKFDKDYNRIEMTGNKILSAELPKQPPAGKLEYFIELKKDDKKIFIPENRTVVIRFKGDVPAWILIPHILIMFTSMLFSTRAAFEFFSNQPKLKFYTCSTIITLFIGGFILGPLMQYYAFGEFWTGIPFGFDLTDNKTLIAMIGWLVAFYKINKSDNPKRWILFASIIMLIVYLIPHSVLGSELDYSKFNTK